MKSWTLPELDRCLAEMRVSPGDTVMVHSSLLALGRLADHPTTEAPRLIAELLLKRIGLAGTLVVPAINFGFCRGEAFDRRSTPSDKMGLLSEYVRSLSGAVRSRHPMQSVAAIGARADSICDPNTTSAFDPGGSFDVLIELNARLLLLGASFQAATVIHHAEQSERVPYRLWKSFSGPYLEDGMEQIKEYRMYVRDLEEDPKLEMSPLENELIARNQLLRAPLGAGFVRSCTFQDLIAAAKSCLKQNPRCLVGRNGK